MPNYDAQLGAVKAGTRAVALEVCAAVKAAGLGRLRQLWGYNPNSKPEHSAGTAVDFMCNRAQGDFIADYLWRNRARLGVRWIIWRQRIRSTSPGKPRTWRMMADRGNSTANHMDHVHVNLTGNMPTGAKVTPRPPAAAATCSSTYVANAARHDPAATGQPVHKAWGPSVKLVEDALHKTGWMPAGAKRDGHYGTDTITAAKGFQAKHSPGLVPDGILGPRELALLFKLAGMNVQVHK